MAEQREDWSSEERALLETAVNEALDGSLGGAARAVGLDRERLVREAREEAESILKSAGRDREKLEEARRWEQERERRPEVPWGDRGPSIASRLVRRLELADVRRMVFAGLVVLAVLPLLASSIVRGTPSWPAWLAIVDFVLFGLAVLGLELIQYFDDDLAPTEVNQERLTAAERNFRSALSESAVRPWLRRRINLERGRSYGTALTFGDHSGLAEIDDPEREVPTDAKRRLTRLFAQMPGGAIGLSGPRGVGKTTLLRSMCADSPGSRSERPVLATVVDAPVEYDAREFVLHLFAKLCAQVLGAEGVAELRSWDRVFDLSARAFSRARVFWHTLGLAVGLVLTGVILLSHGAIGTPSSTLLGIVLIAIGYLLGVLATWRNTGYVRRLLRMSPPARPSPVAGARATASLRLRQIWFQQSFTTGWSGSLKTSIGVEGGVSGGAELSEQQLSFPDIVELLKDFLAQLSSTCEVRIGIDELDKMDDETARRFLNEIKVIFRVPRCFFLVSISEDAMSFFERRGLPFRDVFDSSFDDVVNLSHFRFADSRGLLSGRVLDLPLPFACLLHCMSGGLPRDLIRVARDLVDLRTGTSLDEATADLCAAALQAKVRATRVALRRFDSEVDVTLLARWSEQLELADCHPEALLDICRSTEETFLMPLQALSGDDALRHERRELQRLGTQLAAFAYYVATMLGFFAELDDADRIDAAVKEGEAPSLVDRLGSARQAFATDLNMAWEALSLLRSDLGLETIDFPALPAATHPVGG